MFDFVEELVEKAREIYDDPLFARMYLATVVGRFGARAVSGARRIVPLLQQRSTELLSNTSRDRALLGYVEIPPPGLSVVFLSSSPTAGKSAMPILLLALFPPDQAPGVTFTALPARQTFVLKPSERLFGTNLAVAPVQLRVTSEYF